MLLGETVPVGALRCQDVAVLRTATAQLTSLSCSSLHSAHSAAWARVAAARGSLNGF